MMILVGGEKGGTGKTTIATNLTYKFNDDLLVVDTDMQGSFGFWSKLRKSTIFEEKKINGINYKEVLCVTKLGSSIHPELANLKNKYKNVIVDAGGKDSPELRSSMLVADIFICPLQPSQFDIWTISNMDKLVGEAKIMNPKLQGFLLLNRASTNVKVMEIEEAKELAGDLDNLKLLKAIIKERMAFKRCTKFGLTVFETDDKNSDKAKDEMEALVSELLSELVCAEE